MPQVESKPDLTTPMRVLVIDDQPMIGEAVRRMLMDDEAVEFRYCADPKAALDVAREFQPTVILQDLVMPDVDGLDLVREFHQDEALSRVPLIVLSSREEPATKAEAFARGANDYIVKLPDPVEVLARVRHHSEGYIAGLERTEAYRALEKSESHLREELNKAAGYVRSLLRAPIKERVATRWEFVPSASLGGDAFDYAWIDEDHFGFFLLDVCGHGVGPALLSISAMNLVRSDALGIEALLDPAAVLKSLNEAFQMVEHNGMFFTMVYGVLNVKEGKLRWSGAGHPPALVFRKDGSVEELESQGPMVGVLPELICEVEETTLVPGDQVLLYSDGIFELQQPGGSVASFSDFMEVVRALPAERDLIEDLLARAREIHGSEHFEDDVSLLEITLCEQP